MEAKNMEKENNQTIKCNVCNCKYNDDIDYLCTLNKVDISCTCDKFKCNDKKETICNSFIERN